MFRILCLDYVSARAREFVYQKVNLKSLILVLSNRVVSGQNQSSDFKLAKLFESEVQRKERSRCSLHNMTSTTVEIT
jgi:hypothetical protein